MVERINSIIENDDLKLWEDIKAFPYIESLLLKIGGVESKIGVVVSQKTNDSTISFITRWLYKLGIKDVEFLYAEVTPWYIDNIYLDREIINKWKQQESRDVFYYFDAEIHFTSFSKRFCRFILRHLKISSKDSKYLKMIGHRLVLPFYTIEGEKIRTYVKNNIDGIFKVYDMLEDEISKDTLVEIIRCAITHDVWKEKEYASSRKYFECYKHLEDEQWINCGSALGDTILHFISNGYDYKKIYAFEGDKTVCNELINILDGIDINKRSRIEVKNSYIGIEDGRNTFDELFEDKPVTLINMDIEGAELDVLKGAKKTIERDKPVLAICVYHNPSHLVEIPKYVLNVSLEYSFYLRKYINDHPNNILSEYVLYAVPSHRRVDM